MAHQALLREAREWVKWTMLSGLSLLVVLSSAQAPAPSADTVALKSIYPKFLRAFDTKNWTSISNFMAKDFIHVTPDKKKFGKTAYIKNCQEQFAPFAKMNFKCDLVKFTQVAKGTAIDLTYVMTTDFKDKQGSHRVRASGVETHIWAKAPQGWQINTILEKSSKTDIDGKVVDQTPSASK